MAFIDKTKAFDPADRLTPWKILGKAGCVRRSITIIWLIHENMNAAVLVEERFSLGFEVKKLFKQGCVLAPALFSIFPIAVLELVREEMPNTN